MSEPTEGFLQMEVDLMEIQRKCTDHLQTLVESTTFFYQSAMRFDQDHIDPLPMDSLPIEPGRITSLPIADIKTNGLQWLFKKAVEEMIFGIKESMISAHKFLKFMDTVPSEKIFTVSEIQELETKLKEELQNIAKKADALSLPDLMKETEKSIGQPLALSWEIQSLNVLRNCLVHRNGKPAGKDCKKKGVDALALSYIDLVAYHEIDGVKKEMTWEDKVEKKIKKSVAFTEVPKEILFPSGQSIILDQNIFNGLIYTNLKFITSLFSATLHCMINKQNNLS